MHIYGFAAISDLLGDNVVYRNLDALDERLPRGRRLAASLGMAADTALRKGDAAYAQVVIGLLQAAQALRPGAPPLARLVLVGDTQRSDGGAFTTLCAASSWQGRAFICSETNAPPASTQAGDITYANRWAALRDWSAALDDASFHVDDATAIALDIDKTLVGARGRNDHLIDAARLRALEASVAEVLGGQFDRQQFEQNFRALNHRRFHPLTADNQDYVGYLCTIVAGDVVSLAELAQRAEQRTLPDFDTFLVQIEAARAAEGWPLACIAQFHDDIARRVRAGDATPFKTFRRREYCETAALMEMRTTDIDPAALLHAQLVLTAEVWQAAEAWARRGALLFGLSDKPDEAALPTSADAAVGAQPLHRMKTHIVGE